RLPHRSLDVQLELNEFTILGIFGLANMWEAVFADVGVALLAILNATRVRHYTLANRASWAVCSDEWGL
ncbi:MAG: hypothetical protein QMD16_16610, partial [Desulfitobacteriaceae bacterium]|nr:hypothetical protein [Desulfitobacteriaceae bacterium]